MKWFNLFLAAALMFILAGCATTQKKETAKTDARQLQARVTELEGQLQQNKKQKEENAPYVIEDEEAPQPIIQVPEKPAPVKKSTSSGKITPRNIQKALKNAGLYSGPVDGKIGKNTKSAIKEFQRRNDLSPDGIVGKRTWAKLAEFL